MIIKQTLMNALFNSSEGGGTGFLGSKSGIGTLVSGIGKLVGSFQHGTDYVPETGIAMLHKGERVIPAGENKGGATYYVQYVTNNITATDMKSFEDQLNRNPNAVVEIMRKNARKSGTMKDVIRGAQ